MNLEIEKIQLEGSLYGDCASCHGPTMYSGGMAPDLRASQIPLSKATFAAVVRNGSLTSKGMPAFPEYTDEELEGLQHFIRYVANTTAEEYDELMKTIQ